MAQPLAAAAGRAREYETIYILRPDVAREQAERVSNRVQEVVAREGGKLTCVETWGRRQLAYRVAKYRRGIYVYVKYVGVGDLVSEIERNLRMLDDVIKYQTVKVRDGVDLASVAVDPERVKFEPVELPDEEEVEESLARTLGLEEIPREYGVGSELRGDRDRDADETPDSEESAEETPPLSDAADTEEDET
jgi:small subunit ribosomal protein S6